MNQYAKEIRADLEAMCEKYKIARGILMFQETDKDKSDEERYRVIIFEPNILEFKATVFANLFYRCLQVSRNFQKIIDKVSELSFIEVIRKIQLEEDLKHPNKIKN